MPLDWTAEHEELSHARWLMTDGRMLEIQVESLWEDGWDWQVWDSAGQVEVRYGLAETQAAAKSKAEVALEIVVCEQKMVRFIPRAPAIISAFGHRFTD